MYPSSSFSHFEILTLLGEGSYAKVFKARDRRDGREVAIKILHAHLASQENVRTRFLREADVQTKLYHPNIVKVFEVVEDQGSVGMVMELIEGKTLAEAIARQKHMPFNQIARIMDQILDAVGYAHSHQIVHRDLKPSNILMLGDGTVKVSDFGIARLLHTQGGAGVRTRTGMALGTSYYMSPEQVLGRKDLDHRSDIYALGCILYELLVGHPMFFEFEQQTDDPDFLIKNAHVQQPVPDPQKERPDIPAGVVAVLKQALAKKPEDRFNDCVEMRFSLKEAFKSQNTQEPVIISPEEHKTSSLIEEKEKGVNNNVVIDQDFVIDRKRRWRRVVVLSFVILAILGAGFSWRQIHKQSRRHPPQKNLVSLPKVEKSDSPDKNFTYDCPEESSPPMGFSPAIVGELQESRRTTLHLPCPSGKRCRILAAPVVEKDTLLVVTTDPGQVLAWQANTLKLLWQATLEGDVVASPLVWENRVVIASKDKKIRLYALDSGKLLFESKAADEYFTATPFISKERVIVPGWDHTFHVIEPSLGPEPFAYFPRKVPVHGILMHPPTRIEGNNWFFAGTRILEGGRYVSYHSINTLKAGRYVFTFYIPLNGDTFRVQPENKARLCVVGTSEEDVQDRRVVEQCPMDAIVMDPQPTLNAYPPLVTPNWAWFFLYGGPITDPEGIVVLCSRTKGRCWRVLRGGTYGRPTAGRIGERPFGVFTLYRDTVCTMCGFYLDQYLVAGEDSLQCVWKKTLVGCPGDLRWMGDEIVFGTNRSRLIRVSAANGNVLQEVQLSGRAAAAPVRCRNRLFIGTLNQSIDIFDLELQKTNNDTKL